MKQTLLRTTRRLLFPSTLRPASKTSQTTPHAPTPTVPSHRRQNSTTTPPNTPSKETLAPRTTHYDFFPLTLPAGAPPSGPFTIDLRALRTEFLRLQAKTHPDLHPGPAKPKAEALSARVNEAYKTLQDPLLRAQYLLSLRGIDVANDEAGTIEDQELLMSVMEAQEVIEEAGSEADLAGVKAQNERDVEESVRVLEGAFARGDLEAAREESVRLRYWVNIGQGVRDWEPGREVRLVH